MTNIRTYEQERDSLRSSLNDRVVSLRDLLNKFYRDDSDGFIKVEDFRGLNIGERYDVSEGVYFTPLDFNDDYLEFHTGIKGGYFYGVQWHDKMEICKVTKGEMVDLLSGETCKVGESITFKAYDKHKPGAYVDTESNVKFYLK